MVTSNKYSSVNSSYKIIDNGGCVFEWAYGWDQIDEHCWSNQLCPQTKVEPCDIPSQQCGNVCDQHDHTKFVFWFLSNITAQQRTCEANPVGKNSSLIFTVCVKYVPLYHFKLAYVVLYMAVKEFFKSHFLKWKNRLLYSLEYFLANHENQFQCTTEFVPKSLKHLFFVLIVFITAEHMSFIHIKQ